MIKPFFSALVVVGFLLGGWSSARAQGYFAPVALTGTVSTEDGFGQVVSKPLTEKLVLQLCGITLNTSDYKLVAGTTLQSVPDEDRSGIFVVNQDGIVQKGFVEFPSQPKSGDGTTGVSLGGADHMVAVAPVIAVLENSAVSGAASMTAKRGKISTISVTAGVDDQGNPKLIMKAKFTLTGPFKITPMQSGSAGAARRE